MNKNSYLYPSNFAPDELSVLNESHMTALGDLSEQEENCDIYLVKVPIGIDARHLHKQKIFLEGVTELGKFNENDSMMYECHSTQDPDTVDRLAILLPNADDPSLMNASTKKFKGQLNIIKTFSLPSESEISRSNTNTSVGTETHSNELQCDNHAESAKSKKSKKKKRKRTRSES